MKTLIDYIITFGLKGVSDIKRNTEDTITFYYNGTPLKLCMGNGVKVCNMSFVPKILETSFDVDSQRYVYLAEYRTNYRNMNRGDLPYVKRHIRRIFDELREIKSDTITVDGRYRKFIDTPYLSYWDIDVENIMIGDDIYFPDLGAFEYARQPLCIQNEFDMYMMCEMDDFHSLYIEEREREEQEDDKSRRMVIDVYQAEN